MGRKPKGYFRDEEGRTRPITSRTVGSALARGLTIRRVVDEEGNVIGTGTGPQVPQVDMEELLADEFISFGFKRDPDRPKLPHESRGWTYQWPDKKPSGVRITTLYWTREPEKYEKLAFGKNLRKGDVSCDEYTMGQPLNGDKPCKHVKETINLVKMVKKNAANRSHKQYFGIKPDKIGGKLVRRIKPSSKEVEENFRAVYGISGTTKDGQLVSKSKKAILIRRPDLLDLSEFDPDRMPDPLYVARTFPSLPGRKSVRYMDVTPKKVDVIIVGGHFYSKKELERAAEVLERKNLSIYVHEEWMTWGRPLIIVSPRGEGIMVIHKDKNTVGGFRFERDPKTKSGLKRDSKGELVEKAIPDYVNIEDFKEGGWII